MVEAEPCVTGASESSLHEHLALANDTLKFGGDGGWGELPNSKSFGHVIDQKVRVSELVLVLGYVRDSLPLALRALKTNNISVTWFH
jgi:hypothetical protein